MNSDTYICKDCNKVSPRSELPAKGWNKCKSCISRYLKAYRAKNKAKASAYGKRYRIEEAESVRAQRKQYRIKNAGKIKIAQKENRAKRGKIYDARNYVKKVKRLRTDPVFRLQETIRARMTAAIKTSAKVGSAIKLLGCSVADFKLHVEAKFLPGMTWENWSLRGWHLDHIKPLSSFNLSDPKQLAEACHFSNMQPLWALDNIRKSNKY